LFTINILTIRINKFQLLVKVTSKFVFSFTKYHFPLYLLKKWIPYVGLSSIQNHFFLVEFLLINLNNNFWKFILQNSKYFVNLSVFQNISWPLVVLTTLAVLRTLPILATLMILTTLTLYFFVRIKIIFINIFYTIQLCHIMISENYIRFHIYLYFDFFFNEFESSAW